MTMGLTISQSRCLEAIAQYQADNGGVSPSYDELAAVLGWKAKSQVHTIVVGLEQRGRIRRLRGRRRALEIVDTRSKPVVHYTNAAYMVWDDEKQTLKSWVPRTI